MSAANGGIPSDEEKTFFNSVQTPFPDVRNGKINTFDFLESSKGVVSLVDKFGKVFAPVKYDMSGNIEKLSQKYNTNKENYMYLDDMILCEKREGQNYATDALLWLRRALHFIYTFFQCILEDTQKEEISGDLKPFLKKAYKETLERYHGWMAQQLFAVLARMCPPRKELMITLALGRENREEAVLRDMAVFLQSLDSNLKVLIAFYINNNLESDIRV